MNDGQPESVFKCNICSAVARDPVLTQCGHIYCWPCFHQIEYAPNSNRKWKMCDCGCPVPEGSVVPVYGTDNDDKLPSDIPCRPDAKLPSDIPCRPDARRMSKLSTSLATRLGCSSLASCEEVDCEDIDVSDGDDGDTDDEDPVLDPLLKSLVEGVQSISLAVEKGAKKLNSCIDDSSEGSAM